MAQEISSYAGCSAGTDVKIITKHREHSMGQVSFSHLNLGDTLTSGFMYTHPAHIKLSLLCNKSF